MMLKEIKDYLDLFEDCYFRFYEIGDRGLIDIKIAGVEYGYQATISGNVAHLRKGIFNNQTGEEFTLSENRISVDDFKKIKELIGNKIGKIETKLVPELLGFISFYSGSLIVQEKGLRINIGNDSDIFYTLVATENGEPMLLKRNKNNKALFNGNFITTDDLDGIIETLEPYKN